jgi:poly(A) polymerase
VFDEMLKLLMSGHAMACLQQLRKEGLHHGLLPLLDVVLEQPLGVKFVTLALDSTDKRIHAGKTVSPGFLFASLLWHQVLEKWDAYKAAGEFPIPALHLAADDVLESQTEKLALQRKIGSDMRDIWAMQPRFERRQGKNPYKLLEHPRFRAGYDFLLLRGASGEIDAELGEWWTAFYEGDEATREDLVANAGKSGGEKRKRAPRRGKRGAAAEGADSASAKHADYADYPDPAERAERAERAAEDDHGEDDDNADGFWDSDETREGRGRAGAQGEATGDRPRRRRRRSGRGRGPRSGSEGGGSAE